MAAHHPKILPHSFQATRRTITTPEKKYSAKWRRVKPQNAGRQASRDEEMRKEGTMTLPPSPPLTHPSPSPPQTPHTHQKNEMKINGKNSEKYHCENFLWILNLECRKPCEKSLTYPVRLRGMVIYSTPES